jgi:hypothetical protein
MSRNFIVSSCMMIAVLTVSAPAFGQCQTSAGPDVIVGTVGQIQGSQQIANYTGSSGLDAFSMGTTSCNIGTSNVTWQQSPNPNHPVVGQNLFRLKSVNGSYRFEHVGMGWLKHTFTALTQNVCCTCSGQGGTVLGVGCSDPYTASRNGGQSSAGPKWQINATLGTNIQPIASPSFSGQVARRVEVLISDLEASTTVGAATKYFGECQYVTADDAAAGSKNNNASYRQMSVANVSGTDWNIGYFGSDPNVETHRQQPAIRAWGDNVAGVTYTNIVTPEVLNADPDLAVGLVILAAKATDLGGGQWHYEYAAQNLNSDRSVSSFSIPVGAGATVTNIGFHDIAYRDGDGESSVNRDDTDWPGVRNTNDVTWTCTQTFAQNSNANALRWGTLYNFRFDCNTAPDSGSATLGLFKPAASQPNSVAGTTVVPTASVPCDPPFVFQPPAQSAACGVAYSYAASASGTAPLTWTLANEPSGMTIDSNGQVSWPSPTLSGAPYVIGITASSNCGSSNDSKNLVLTVALGDVNGDGRVDIDDTDALVNILLDISTTGQCAADLNLDGAIDGLDIDKYLEMLGIQ